MLYISEKTWIKWLFCRMTCNKETVSSIKNGDFLEISLLGISGDKLNHIQDLYIPYQTCSAGTTELDDDKLADYIDRMNFEHNLSPKRTNRVWFHTHPGESVVPSSTDNETFENYYGGDEIDYAIMAILGAKNNVSCLAKYQTIFGIEKSEKPVVICLEKFPEKTLSINKYMELFNSLVKEKLPYDNIFANYTHLYEEWKADIKEKVSLPVIKTNTNIGYHQQSPYYGNFADCFNKYPNGIQNKSYRTYKKLSV